MELGAGVGVVGVVLARCMRDYARACTTVEGDMERQPARSRRLTLTLQEKDDDAVANLTGNLRRNGVARRRAETTLVGHDMLSDRECRTAAAAGDEGRYSYDGDDDAGVDVRVVKFDWECRTNDEALRETKPDLARSVYYSFALPPVSNATRCRSTDRLTDANPSDRLVQTR
jgi:hypothetical protein